jgi:hypothetical protein
VSLTKAISGADGGAVMLAWPKSSLVEDAEVPARYSLLVIDTGAGAADVRDDAASAAAAWLSIADASPASFAGSEEPESAVKAVSTGAAAAVPMEGWLESCASVFVERAPPPPHAESSVRMAATELLSSKRGWAGARYGWCILGTYCWVGAAWRSVVRRLKVIVGSGGPDFACRLLTLQKQ